MCGSKSSGTLFLLFELLTGAGKFSLFEHVSRDLIRHSEAASWLILANKTKDIYHFTYYINFSGSQNVYSRAEGIADHYWPRPIFFSSYSYSGNIIVLLI
jgi:hypothetical protein